MLKKTELRTSVGLSKMLTSIIGNLAPHCYPGQGQLSRDYREPALSLRRGSLQLESVSQFHTP